MKHFAGLCWAAVLAISAHAQDVIEIDFWGMETGAALRAIARQAGINLLVSDGIKGSLSLQWRDTDWTQALQGLVHAQGLVLVRNPGLWWVGTQAEWLALEKGRQEVRALQQTQAELVLRTHRLHHGRATEWLDQLLGHGAAEPATRSAATAAAAGRSAAGSRWLSPRGQVMADPRTNHLVVLDTLEVQERLAQWIAQLDVPQRQVQIEARIVEATEGFGRSLGARIQGFNDRLSLDWSAPALSGLPAARAALTLLGPSASRQVVAEISALQENGLGRLVATPSLVTADQSRATIEQGTELPYQVGSTAGNSHTIAFRKAELRLDVLPQITAGGEIQLDLDLRRDSVGELTSNGYAIDTKRLQTQVRVPDGGTLVIGGIFVDDQHEQKTRLPGVADWPWVRWLLGQSRERKQRQELMIFITPKMLSVHPLAATEVAP